MISLDVLVTPNSSRVESFDYDDLGRITHARNYDGNGVIGQTTSTAPKVEQRYVYDVLTSADASDFVRTDYSQHAIDNVGIETLIGSTTYFTDNLGRTAKLEDVENLTNGITDKLVEYTYDAADQLRSIKRTASTNTFRFDTTYDYDQSGRIIDIAHFRPLASNSQIPFTTHRYQYDAANRIIQQKTGHDIAISAFSQSDSYSVKNFTFDATGQLTVDDDRTYQYDDNGNRTSVDLVIDAHNRLTEDADYSYQYDNEGNLTRRTPKENGVASTTSYTEYTWDHRNRLVKAEYYDTDPTVSTPEVAQSVEYTYNADDLLVHRRKQKFWIYVGPMTPGYDNPVIEHFVYDNNNRVLQLDDNDTLECRYTQGPIVDQVLFDEVFDEMGQQEDLITLAADHLQSTRAILDKTGQIIQTLEYNSFGNVSELRDASGNPLQTFILGGNPPVIPNTSELATNVTFSRKYWDEDTGLYYNRARWYDSDTGRFISEDPIGFADGPNVYRYAGNDPINFRDPTGLSQAGNPLNNLFGTNGGFSGGVLAPAPESTNLSLQQIYGTSPFSSFGSLSTPTVRQTNITRSVPLAFPNSVLQTSPFKSSASLQRELGQNFTSTTQANRRTVREIVPQVPIVPRDANDLPGIRNLAENPNRYIVSNHNDQGYFVYDTVNGNARFVTGGDYLPIRERSRRARIESDTAASHASGFTFTQEVMVAFSPIHETSRDFGISLFGHDYVEPNRVITGQDQLNAGLLLVMPGGNSSQVRYADDALDALRRVGHKNSMDYVGDTHVYRIKGPDGTYKIGESAQGLRVRDGASIRAEQQVRKLNREVGPGHTAEIRKTFPDKRSARSYETGVIERFRRMFGADTLPGNKTNR